MSQVCRLSFHGPLSSSLLLPPDTARILRPRMFHPSLAPLLIVASRNNDETFGERVWREYGKAVEKKDLKKALRILEAVQVLEKPREDFRFATDGKEGRVVAVGEEDEGGGGGGGEEGVGKAISFRDVVDDDVDVDENEDIFIPFPPLDLRNLLDTCLTATDMKLVARTYAFLRLRGLLPSFGRYRNIPTESLREREITPSAFLEASGLEASKLAPKKWGLDGNSALVLGGSLILFNFLVNSGIDVRPFLTSILTFGILDAVFLGGTGLASILISWPPYKRRVFIHEAGHILVAYLLGCPIRGVILDPVQAMQLGIQGQAGTQFWDQMLEGELREGRLTNASFDRYSMILFAGIAAEAIVYGEAEGGESDENLFRGLVSVIRPPWTPAQISNQARWAVLESFKLLKEHRQTLDAVVSSLYEGAALGAVVRDLEESLSS